MSDAANDLASASTPPLADVLAAGLEVAGGRAAANRRLVGQPHGPGLFSPTRNRSGGAPSYVIGSEATLCLALACELTK